MKEVRLAQCASLRDWFAGMVLQGMMTNPNNDGHETHELAAAAFSFADAMLAEREKGGEG